MYKIAYLQHGLGYGGATKSLILLQDSVKKEFDLCTYTLPYKKKYSAISDEFGNSQFVKQINMPTIHSHVISTTKSRDFKNRIAFYPEKFIHDLIKEKIDILHINSTLFSHILKPIKESTNIKIIVHLREMLPIGYKNPVDNFIIKNTLEYADVIIAITSNEAKFFPDTNKVIVIPNPHPFSETDECLVKKQKNDITIGMCAAFLEYKGHLIFLEMAKIINQINKLKDINFKIIGYPGHDRSLRNLLKNLLKYGYKNKFDEKIKKLKLNNLQIINFTYDVYNEINDWTIYIRPDLTGQPWGRDIIEAMALKKPVIATGESEFFVENGKTGYLIPPRNPEAMAEKVIELIRDENKQKQFGESGYEKIKKLCDMDQYGIKILDIYKSLVGFK